MAANEDNRGPGRPSGEHASNVRAALVAAARDCIVEVGFAAASTKDIAARAGVNPAMINYYFGSKAALGEATFRETIEPLRQRFERLASMHGGDVALESFVRECMGALAENSWIPRLIVREVLPDNGQFREIFFSEIVGRGAAILPRAIAQAQRNGSIARRYDPVLATITIASLAVFPFLAAPILNANLGVDVSDAETFERLVAHTLAVLSHGLGKSPGAG